MRIGILGGTFNPPHLGHLTSAKAVMERLQLDKLLLIPDGIPPHKEMPQGSPSTMQRLEMTRMAADFMELGDKVEVLDWEIKREGKSFTADTLAQVHKAYPQSELWLLMGTDMFCTFHQWKRPEEIVNLASIVAFSRTGEEAETLLSAQREALYKAYPNARLYTMNIPGVVEISSTQLRWQIANGQGSSYFPPAVYGYILRHGLYGTAVDMKQLTMEQLRYVSLCYLKHKRIPHVLGCEQEAIRLAIRYGADVKKAQIAALLHDCTKFWDMETQLACCAHYGMELDKIERKTPKLLHAKTGAAIARDVFGVDDEIYGAIYHHTTGHKKMTLLEKVIYLADYIEPSRNFDGLEQLRTVCYQDIDQGFRLGLSMTVEDMSASGASVHKATLEALQAMKGGKHR